MNLLIDTDIGGKILDICLLHIPALRQCMHTHAVVFEPFIPYLSVIMRYECQTNHQQYRCDRQIAIQYELFSHTQPIDLV